MENLNLDYTYCDEGRLPDKGICSLREQCKRYNPSIFTYPKALWFVLPAHKNGKCVNFDNKEK